MLDGHKGDAGKRSAAVAAACLALAGCGGTPVRGDLRPPPQPAPSAATQEQSAPAAPATVEATVVTQPLGRTTYRIIRVTIPKGVTSLSLTIPGDILPDVTPPAAITPAQGGEKDCSEGFFSCSKLISETVTAVVAAILALLGLYRMLRKKRGR